MPPTTRFFPFVSGLSQSVDDRMLDPGRPRAIENLVIEKKGRLRMRYDYDALQSSSSDANLRLYDLHVLSGKLLALSQFDGQDDTAPTNYIEGIHQYTGIAANAWVRLSQPALPPAARMRSIIYLALQVSTVTIMDVAAGNGIVGMMWLEDLAGAGVLSAQVLFVKAATGERIGTPFTVFTGANTFIRIVFLNGKFFMGGVNATTNAVKLTSYDPVTDTRVLLTDPLAAQANAINAFDMSMSHEGTTFWIAFGLANTTTGIRGYDNTGAQTYTAAGPAVLATAITILAEATNGTLRFNLLIRISATSAIDAYTYVPPATVPALSTPNMFTPDTTTRQPTMCMRTANNNHVMVAYQIGNNIQQRAFNDTTHALIAAADFLLFDSQLTSKMMSIRGQRFVGVTEVHSASPVTITNMLYQFTNLTVTGATDGRARPVAFGEPNFALAGTASSLEHIAHDVSTGLSYWGRLYIAEFIGGAGVKTLPIVSEIALVETSRRQSVQMGPDLYLTGGITMVIDGISAAESGGFMTPPRISNISTSGVGGSIPAGTYQIVAVFEMFNSQRERIQSVPSPVATAGPVAGATASITLSVSVPHTFWDASFLSSTRGPATGKPLVVFYRTKDIGAGNLTFYREKSVSIATASAGLITTTLVSADATLETGEVLYTQGARGSLSGPLPFEVCMPSVSIAASADRGLLGGLPDTSNIQESRPLFPAEPLEWSQSIAFFRATRGDVLAVARLDERRIVFTANEIFEVDGEGVDDNGVGTIGAPRRLPSDVGLFGGLLGWRSLVECQLGIMFQGLADQIYLLPRGGTTPQPIGIEVQDKLAAFPSITSAVYVSDDRTVRFTCNNSATAPTDSITLIYDLVHQMWITEGPYGAATVAGVAYQGRMTRLQGTLSVLQQRVSHPPAAIIANAWRSGTIHPFGLGQFGKVLNYQFYGEYRGDCSLKCIATYDDTTVETMRIAEVNAITIPDSSTAQNDTAFFGLFGPTTIAVGSPSSFKFTPNQMKCECVRVDFEVDVPFPNIIAGLSTQTGAGLKVNTINVSLSSLRAAGDRMVIIFMQASVGANPPTSAGWTQRNSATTSFSRTTTMERIFDGSEVSPVTFNWTGTACAMYAIGWLIRNSHASSAIEVFSSGTGVTPATTLFSSAFTPSWGLNENSLYLSALAIDTVPSLALTNTPASTARFRQRVQFAGAINADPDIDGLLAGTDRATRPVAFNASWSWPALSTAVAPLIAVRPNAAIPSEGLAYHYWAMDVEDAGKSALKSPLQMG